MMRMTEKLPDRQFMMHQISVFHLGIKFPEKEEIFVKVINTQFFKNVFLELLEKNRHKRPVLEEVLKHPWFSDFKDIHNLRVNKDLSNNNALMFQIYT